MTEPTLTLEAAETRVNEIAEVKQLVKSPSDPYHTLVPGAREWGLKIKGGRCNRASEVMR